MENIDTKLVTGDELSKVLGITTSRINQLRREGHLAYAEGKTGLYEFGPTTNAYCERLRDNIAKRSVSEGLDEGQLDIVFETARYKKTQADLFEIKLATAKADLMPMEDMLEVWQRIIDQAEIQLDYLKERIIERVPYLNKKEKEIIRLEIKTIFDHLVEDGERAPEQAIQITIENAPESANL